MCETCSGEVRIQSVGLWAPMILFYFGRVLKANAMLAVDCAKFFRQHLLQSYTYIGANKSNHSSHSWIWVGTNHTQWDAHSPVCHQSCSWQRGPHYGEQLVGIEWTCNGSICNMGQQTSTPITCPLMQVWSQRSCWCPNVQTWSQTSCHLIHFHTQHSA